MSDRNVPAMMIPALFREEEAKCYNN